MYRLIIVFMLLVTTVTQAQQCDKCVGRPIPNCKVDRESSFLVYGCRVGVTASWDGWSAPSRSDHCMATLPDAYMLVDYEVVEIESNNGGMSVSRYAKGTDLDYRRIVDEDYKTALDIAAKISDSMDRTAVEAQINGEYKQRIELIEKLKSNKDTVDLMVTATPHGSAVDRKRGWETAEVYLRVMCVAPTDLLDQIKNKYNLDAKTGGTPRTVQITNRAGDARFLIWKPADRFTDCTDSTASVSATALSKAGVEIALDPVLSLCYTSVKKMDIPPVFSNNCRAKFGDTVDIRDRNGCAQ